MWPLRYAQKPRGLLGNKLDRTQVRFALSSSPTFSRTDLVTDSEHFYGSIVEALTDDEYRVEVERLLTWWDAYVMSLVLMIFFIS